MAEVEESIKKQISVPGSSLRYVSRLAFGSLEMTIYKVFNSRAIGSGRNSRPMTANGA